MWRNGTHVDLMVIHLSCSSLRVSVKRVSPARAPAMIPAFETSESVSVDLPWSTWAMTDMLRMFRFLSIMPRISSTVKFTWTDQKTTRQHRTHHNTDGRPLVIRTFHFSKYRAVGALRTTINEPARPAHRGNSLNTQAPNATLENVIRRQRRRPWRKLQLDAIKHRFFKIYARIDNTITLLHFSEPDCKVWYSPYWMVFDFSFNKISYHTPAMAYAWKRTRFTSVCRMCQAAVT